MIANVILGITIDTEKWIYDLQAQNSEYIYVIDYDYFGEPALKDGVIYTSLFDAKKQFKQFDSIIFYKSLYIYPGLNGKMSSLYKN